MDIYRQIKYLDPHEMKYERLAEQLRRNSSVPAEQDVGSYVVCRQQWQDGEMQENCSRCQSCGECSCAFVSLCKGT